MSNADLRTLTRAVPFRPFRIFVTNGEVYEIRHPDMMLLLWDSIHVALPQDKMIHEDLGSFRIISLNHIVKIESLANHAIGTAA